jgi:opacity protein-like surface antigen
VKWLLACLIVLSAAPAYSQGFEAAVVGGYTTPGGIDHSALGITDLKLRGSFTWGASASYFFSPRLGVEASWARQESALRIGTAAGSADMFDVNVDQLHGSLVFQMGCPEARVRPFLTAGLGAAFFSAPDLEGETKLSLGLGAGVRWLPTSRLGARLQARYTPTHLNDASSDFCDPFGFCQGWLQQFEMTGGLVLRF